MVTFQLLPAAILLSLPSYILSYSPLDRLQVHKVPLERNDVDSPFAFAVSSPCDLAKLNGCNFLATQVWPSARSAAFALKKHLDLSRIRSLCEFGCGPGLPSLTAAALGASVVATDVDRLALELVDKAAQEQGLSDRLTSFPFDLLQGTLDQVPPADLYLMSDVFESNHVSRAAARLVLEILSRRDDSHVWVFAQSDRVQRESFVQELVKITNDASLKWRPVDEYSIKSSRLWLCDVDESLVVYS